MLLVQPLATLYTDEVNAGTKLETSIIQGVPPNFCCLILIKLRPKMSIKSQTGKQCHQF